MALETPILLLGFNRPDEMRGLIESIRPQSPESVYVAVDGPRAGRPEEEHRVLETRSAVELIDWPCRVRTLFREDNFGCGPGVSNAISWFLDHEEAGIILEDDIRPTPDFFPFVEELLHRYADDERVWAVSGNNFVPTDHLSSPDSYRFSVIPHIWGWATWRRSWRHYRFDISGWNRSLSRKQLFDAAGRSPAGYAFWWRSYNQVARRADTWDYQFTLAAMALGSLTATANLNLTENIGFGADSTHTTSAPAFLQPVAQMRFPLTHPRAVQVDPVAEKWTRQHVCGATYRGIAQKGAEIARAGVGSRMPRHPPSR